MGKFFGIQYIFSINNKKKRNKFFFSLSHEILFNFKVIAYVLGTVLVYTVFVCWKYIYKCKSFEYILRRYGSFFFLLLMFFFVILLVTDVFCVSCVCVCYEEKKNLIIHKCIWLTYVTCRISFSCVFWVKYGNVC